ncbi:MAG: LUD domain-containing protein [bacterium]
MFTLKQILQLRKSFNEVKERKKKRRFKINKGLLRRFREESVGNQKLLQKTVDQLKSNGIKVILAEKKDDALNFLKEELKDYNVIVKSKSNVSKELKITDFLNEIGKTVVETDIGDRLLQITNEKPSHPTGPASHLSINDIQLALENYFGHKISNVPEEIVAEIKKDIISYINKAEVAIVGANAITADEGAIVIIHNEGNVSEIIQKTNKLIVVTGVEKIYNNLENAITMVKALTYNATGAKTTSFINIITAPSKTADIEKKLIKGVYSPQEIIVILLNNKREEISQSKFKELLYCIGCGFCLVACPMYLTVGDRYGVDENIGGRGILLSYLRDENKQAAKTANLCLSCFNCKKNCPININIPRMVWQIRKMEGQNNLVAFIYAHFVYIVNSFVTIHPVGK